MTIGIVASACGGDDAANGQSASATTVTTVTPPAGPAPDRTTTVPEAPSTSTTATTVPARDVSPLEITDRCADTAESIVAATMLDISGGATVTACANADSQKRLNELVSSSFGFGFGFDFEIDSVAVRFENPVEQRSGWSVNIALDIRDGEGATERRIQAWTLTDSGSNLVITSIDDLRTDDLVAAAEDAVESYLADLAAGRFDAAAKVLGEGGQNWDDRFDLTAFPLTPTTQEELAEQLRQWCISAQCTAPTNLSARPTIRGVYAEVTAQWGAGDAVTTATFVGGSWEGQPAVIGLPPLVDVSGEAAIDLIAEATGAKVVVLQAPDGSVVASTDGRVADIPIPSDVLSWSDGTFVHWQVWTEGPAGEYSTTSTVADFSGTIVCEAAGTIHLVRRLPDGSHVASVERNDEAVPGPTLYPIPNYAVDCSTGAAQPIEPRSFGREGGSLSTSLIGGRTFTFSGDAEGNADVLNDDGVSINGDDYAGSHTFSPGAETVLYGDFGTSISPHVTKTIRLRDTSTGDLTWTVELPRVFATLNLTEDRAIVGLPSLAAQHEPWSSMEVLQVRDAATGERIVDIPTALTPLFIG